MRRSAGARQVSDVIDFRQEQHCKAGLMVAAGVCDELDGLKHTWAGLPDFLTQANPIT